MGNMQQIFGPSHVALDAPVIIVGAGFSGMAMAIELKKRKIDFLILEKGMDVGGTWRDNVYPGAACDVPSHMYCYSYEPHRWSRSFAAQPEILQYMQAVAKKHDIYSHIKFGCEVSASRYDDASATWLITCADGREFRSRVAISARGALHIPAYPKISGLDQFKGVKMHSARWDHSVELKGKRIAVIGTGASAIQIIPEMAKIAGELFIYQRTPAWVLPKPDHAFRDETKDRYDNKPLSRWMYRNKIYWTLEFNATGFLIDPRMMKYGEKFALKNLAKVEDEATRKALTPTYTLGCKRVLMSNSYYKAFNKPNVHLIHAAVEGVGEHTIRANGQDTEVDVIIFCTGFDVTNQAEHFSIHGKNNTDLLDHWQDGMKAYLGTVSHNFPNAFFLLGPNTGLGHNSIIFMIESQARYIAQALDYMKAHQISSFEVSQAAEDKFVNEMRTRTKGSVWADGGCASWYLDKNGNNTTLWPSFTFNYWLKTRLFDPTPFLANGQPVKSGSNLIKRILARA